MEKIIIEQIQTEEITKNRTDVNYEIKTIKQFSQEMKSVLEKEYPYIWLRGEVGAVKLHSSGHKYFSLKEDDYVINAICWRGTSLSIDLEEGAIIECYGKITIFAGRSSYQIIVQEAREINKQGNILFQLEELKKKLIKEGLFEISKKKAIPKFPETIAILTSPTGAVFHDIMHRINDRYPCCSILFFPINVQGSNSEESIIGGLDKVEAMKDKIDTVILARGGGSLEDLWVFNNENVVRKIASMSIPIISAIGHETDTTLSDFAADLRAPTPTAAAELATPNKTELKNTINMKINNTINNAKEKISKNKNLLETLLDFKYTYQNLLGSFGQKIDSINSNFINNINKKITNIKEELGKLENPIEMLEKFKQKILENQRMIYTITKLRTTEAKNITIQQKIFMEEKEAELKEKVIITDVQNKKITSANSIKSAENFVLKFLDGNVNGTVKK